MRQAVGITDKQAKARSYIYKLIRADVNMITSQTSSDIDCGPSVGCSLQVGKSEEGSAGRVVTVLDALLYIQYAERGTQESPTKMNGAKQLISWGY